MRRTFRQMSQGANYGTILYRLRDSELLVENREIFIPHLFSTPAAKFRRDV